MFADACVNSLERLNRCTISLVTLASRIGDVNNDPKLPIRYSELVEEKINHLKEIASQLNEDIAGYPQLVFSPGELAAELDALITRKEEALAHSKARQQNKTNIELCKDFLHGRCSRGVTCSESHTLDDLQSHVDGIVNNVTTDSSAAEVFTVLEPFGGEAWSALLRSLQHRSFRCLVIRQCDRIALRSIAHCVKHNLIPSLRVVDVSQNNIGITNPAGVLKLATAIAKSSKLEGLSIGYNFLGAAGGLALAASAAENSLSTLSSLNLSGNGVVFHDGAFGHLCEALGNIPTLRKLGLAHNNIGADGTKRLLSALSSSTATTQLEFVDLFATQCGDQGATAIAQYLTTSSGSSLRYLNLGWNRITFEGLFQICQSVEVHSRLEVLRVAYNLGIGRKGSIALAECLKKNQVLSCLDLRWTSLNDDGASTIAEALALNKSLRTIELYGNDLDPRAQALIGEKLKRSKSQQEKGCQHSTTALGTEDEVW